MATTFPNPITIVPMRLRDLVKLFESKSSARRPTRPSKDVNGKRVKRGRDSHTLEPRSKRPDENGT